MTLTGKGVAPVAVASWDSSVDTATRLRAG
jgi:hypothetical protein